MTRLEEVKSEQDDLARDIVVAMRSLRDVNVTQDTITNVTLHAILRQMVDISTTLAIISDELGENKWAN